LADTARGREDDRWWGIGWLYSKKQDMIRCGVMHVPCLSEETANIGPIIRNQDGGAIVLDNRGRRKPAYDRSNRVNEVGEPTNHDSLGAGDPRSLGESTHLDVKINVEGSVCGEHRFGNVEDIASLQQPATPQA
jgi:hypothetical protein